MPNIYIRNDVFTIYCQLITLCDFASCRLDWKQLNNNIN